MSSLCLDRREVGAISACADYIGLGWDYDVERSYTEAAGENAWYVTLYAEDDGTWSGGGFAGECYVELDGDFYETSFA